LCRQALGTQNQQDDYGGKRYKMKTQQRYGLDDWNFSKEIDDGDGREVRIMKRMALRARWPEGGFQ